MLSFEQFDNLHAIWDGRAENVSVCATCGVCCDFTEKSLLPGEREYLAARSGSTECNFEHGVCPCQKYTAKPVICKTFPLYVEVDRTGWFVDFRQEVISDHYTTRCQQLVFDPAKVKPFLDYLFQDYETRMWWWWNYNADNAVEDLRRIYKSHGIRMSVEELKIAFFEVAWQYPNVSNAVMKYNYAKDRKEDTPAFAG